jgi:hypothetical protein
LSPATSVTEYIIAMSAGPTYMPTSPDATVETITFGTPIGRARIAGVTRAVPPEPPAPTIPARSARVRTNRVSASDIASTDDPRSPVNTAALPAGCCPATSVGVTSACDSSPDVLTSTSVASTPAATMRSRK